MTERYDILDSSDPAYAGQAVYTPRVLRAYDTVVVRLSNLLVWRCPARTIQAQYDRHLSASHLDVGPGSGYYLDHTRGTVERLTLLDPNPEVLRYAGARLRRYRPTLHAADALKPIGGLAPASFRSVGLSYVLHCLPGEIGAKAVVFDHLVPLLAPGGVLFGSTILGRGARHNRLGRTLLRVYNRKGIFGNLEDDLAALERALASRFDRYELRVVGTVGLFAGTVS
jgi:SAM-dependent methyltransferase